MDKRGSGILLHITSLPSSYGVGDLGPEAYRFADFLQSANQCWWQILPLNPTDSLYGNSPYSCSSAFAGNPLFINPDLLIQDGLLALEDLKPAPLFPETYCDFSRATRLKFRLLEQAYHTFERNHKGRGPFETFCLKHSSWLEDYSLFAVLKKRFGKQLWNQWPSELRNRNPGALSQIKKLCCGQIEKEKFWQYLFYKQWDLLKEHCRKKGIRLFGDLAIYVRFDSADVWAHPRLFKLDHEKRPAFVSGVPPDHFSRRGQLWGNPVYRWDVHQKSGYGWWIDRIRHSLTLFDALRIDHFRGFVAFWEVPAGDKTAIHGKWVKAPVDDFLMTLKKHFRKLPIVAEDLGFITPDVRKVMTRFKLPGMKVLLFGFGEDDPEHLFLPHAFEKNFLVYTGTHDNNTARGWFEEEASPEDKKRLFRYLGRKVSAQKIHWALVRLAMMSVAKLSIIPIQDVLGLAAEARMNRPSIARGNWKWRLSHGQITPSVVKRLLEMTKIYGRERR